MAEIRPIRALRYTEKAGKLETCVCPPYDIVGEAEYEALCRANPYNLIRLEKPVGENRYQNARVLLDQWLADGILAQEAQESIYLYREEFTVEGKEYAFDGLVCLVGLVPFSERVILPHEDTLSGAKQDRFELMNATECNFSSVYSLYRDESREIRKHIEKAYALPEIARFTDGEGVTHSLRRIDGKEEIAFLQKAFAEKQLFIADGHHRYETALRFRDYVKESDKLSGMNTDAILMTLVDMEDDGLVVLPTHRLLKDLPFDREAFLEQAGTHFTVREYEAVSDAEAVLKQYRDRHAFALYTGGDGFTLLVGKESTERLAVEGRSQAYASLDVTVLHTLLLEGVLGIDREKLANQTNLRYTRSAEEAVRAVRSGESSAAFLLNPTRVEQIRAVSEAGDRMPQKSTYFYPKLKTGLVMNRFTSEK